MTIASFALAAALVTSATASDHIAGIDIGPAFEARVRRGIEENRKSAAVIRLVGKDGKPVAGARVRVTQTSHDFLFGCTFPGWTGPPQRMGAEGWANWNRLFTRVFNYATTENSLKWTPVEPTEGSYQWESADFIVRWCREHHIKLKGHTLIWPLRNAGVPDWIVDCPPERIAELARKRVATVMGRYKGDIKVWDVVNEATHLDWYEKHWSKDYVLDSFKWACRADPDATLVINDYAGFVGAADRVVALVRRFLARGAPIDVVGEQAHDSPHWYSPQEILGSLDKMASTGLDIHLTEVTFPSNGKPITGGFVSGVWDEANQGRFYRYLFTLAFSHPKVKAITLWAVWDGSSWLAEGGIVRRDWTLKPAYLAIDDLINNKWRTRFEAASDANGEVRFRGFHGDYNVEAAVPRGKPVSAKLRLRAGRENQVRVVVD